MPTRSLRALLRATAVVGSVLALVAVGVPAHADPANAFQAALTTSRGSITVDLSGAQYATQPESLFIEALRNGCDASSPCWAEEDASLRVDSGFTGVYTLNGLKPNTVYQVEVDGYIAGTFIGYVTTPTDVNGAPSAYPLATVSANGLTASVTAQAEYDGWNIHDGGSIASLRYDVIAYVGGKRLKKVLTGVTAGSAHTVSGLPLGTAITFTETDHNSVGESPESTTSSPIVLAAKAPGSFHGTSYAARTSVQIVWQKPAAGTGHLTRFTIRIDRASKAVFTHRYAAKTRDAEIFHLKRHAHYVVFLTAYNSAGKHTTIRGVFTTH